MTSSVSAPVQALDSAPVQAPVSTPDSASARSRLVRLAWLSPGAVALAAFVWNAGALLIDASPLVQPDYSWGIFFLTAMNSFFVGIPILAGVLLTAGLVHRVPRLAKVAYLVGVAVCVLAGFTLGIVGMVQLFTYDLTIEAVFGALTVVAALLLMVPGWFAWDFAGRR